MKKFTIILGQIFFFLILLSAGLHAAPKGTLKGVIKDAQSGESLPFANVIIKGTSLGCAADKDGNFMLSNIPAGSLKVVGRYIGYREEEASITIQEGKTTVHNFSLKPEGVVGKEIVVTGQASGQLAAINEQLSSMALKNVVSAAKIQELPDANAAESVGRLPGVSLMRKGGEGNKVVIRGLSPQYNQVTIDGMEMSSNVASGNNLVSGDANRQDATGNVMGDRGTDLSMVSSNMLGGIEVTKAITPDMDAAVLGGVVNFDMRKASLQEADENGQFRSMPKFEFLSQGGYNALQDTRNDYKFVFSTEKRFFENSFGIFALASAEKRNLSDNELGVNYGLVDKMHGDVGVPELNSLTLTDVSRKLERYGASVVLDYHHETGDIGFMNFYSNSDSWSVNRSETAQPKSTNEQLIYGLSSSQTKLNMVSNLLSIKENFGFFQINMKLSHSYSESKTPENIAFNFLQQKAGLSETMVRLHPKDIASKIVHDSANAYLYNLSSSATNNHERSYTGSIDFLSDMTFGDYVTVKLKFGGMYQYRDRSYDFDQNEGAVVWDQGALVVAAFRSAYPNLRMGGTGLALGNFIYDGYSYGDFLKGDYKIAYPLNDELMRLLMTIAQKKAPTLTGAAYKVNPLACTLNDYSGTEKKSAAYFMTTINIGDQLTLLPGVRYQNLTTEYTAMRGESIPGGIQGGNTTITKSHDYFLPMVHIRYKPLPWLQLQFAYTNTITYPDYSAITPRYYIGSSFISYNNTDLKPATSRNFDLVASVFSNEVGLFTVNAFQKKIKDLVFYSHTYIDSNGLKKFPELPQGRSMTYDFTTYINSPYDVDVNGIEADWQTRFWYLPAPFDGIVFNINYTHIFSEAKYPKSEKKVTYSEDGTAVIMTNDTLYTTRLLNQPNDILNMGIGYDYKGFSARVSMLYQDNIFRRPEFWMQDRVNSDKATRWDLSVKQELPWYGIQVYFNLNNITGQDDVDLNQKTSFPASTQRYGMSGDIGFRLKF